MRKLNDIEKKVIEWNQKFPIDKWWRDKHGVAFMSEQHKSTSFLSQLFEFKEDMMMLEFKNTANDYIPNQGEFFIEDNEDQTSKIVSAKEEFESEFHDLLNG